MPESDGISELDPASTLIGTEPIPTVQGGITVRTTPDAIKDLIAASPVMQFKGQADASAIDEAAATGTSTFQNGDVYRINVAATAPHAFSDITEDLLIGDWVVFNGTIFQKQDGTDPTAAETKTAYESNADTNAFTDADETKLDGIAAGAQVNTVDDVFGRTGNVVAAASDYDASQVDNDSDVNGAFVSDALSRLKSIPWDVNHVISKNEFDTSAQTSASTGIYISDNGLKMYISDVSNGTVFQYTLSTAFDVSTASFDSKSFAITTEASNLESVWLSIDGLKFFATTSTAPARVLEYSLSTAFDISTASFNTSLNISAQETETRDLFFRADGLKLFISGPVKVFQYTLTVAYDLSTASFDSVSFDVSAQTTILTDAFFKDDGLKMFVTGFPGPTGVVFQYTLSTAWDVSTATFDSVSFDTGATSINSIFFKKHGATFYVISGIDQKVRAFEVSIQEDNPFTDNEKTKLDGIEASATNIATDNWEDMNNIAVTGSLDKVIPSFDTASGTWKDTTLLSTEIVVNDQSSGMIDGAIVSINADTTKFDISAGHLYIIDSFTDLNNPTITHIEFTAQSAIAATELLTDNETFVGIRVDNVAPANGTATAFSATINGAAGTAFITQKPSAQYTREETRDIVQIGAMLHSGSVISDVFNIQQIVQNVALQLYDLAFAIGVINISGNEFSANGVNLNIDKSTGEIFRQGSNNDGTPAGLKNPNITITGLASPATFNYRHRNGVGGFVVLPDTTLIDPDQFDDGSGTLAAVSGNRFTIKKLYVGTGNEIRIEYGQAEFTSLAKAEAEITTSTVTDPVLTAETAFRGWLIVQKGTTDLTDTSKAKFMAAGKFNITTAGATSGEINTASNIGTGGVGIFKQKDGVNLELKNINAGSSKISITDDTGQNEIDVDVVPANINTSALNNDANFADDQTGAEIKIAYEAEVNTNAFTDAEQVLVASALQNVIEDTTPQLGGTLDMNSQNMTGFLNLKTGAKASAGEQSRLNVGTDEVNQLELAIRVVGAVSASDRFAELQAIEFGIANRTLALNPAGGNVGIGTVSPDSVFHIKASTPGTIGDFPAGQFNIQNPNNDVNANVVITGYKSDVSGNPDLQLWYLGSSSGSNESITFLNRRNDSLSLGTNSSIRLTILADGNVGIGTAIPSSTLHADSNAANTVAIMTLENTAGNIQLFRTDATPEGAITGSIGDLAMDSTGGVFFIKETGTATNTGWVAFDSGAAGDMLLGTVQQVTAEKNFDSGTLKLNGATSGKITLNATAVAGTGTLTLPVATDTLVGKATTDTLTNKTVDLTDNTVTGTTAEFQTANSDGTFKVAGKETIWIPATGMTPATTSGALTGQIESATNKVNIETLNFDATADEFAHFNIAMPKSWNLGTVTYQVFWSTTAVGTTGVAWALQGVAIADGDAIDTAYGTAVVVTDDAQTAAGDTLVTVESAAVTIAGTPADDEMSYFRLFRDVSDANDDMTEDAQLIGIKLFFTLDAEDDA